MIKRIEPDPQAAGRVDHAATDPIAVMVEQIDHLSARQFAAILGHGMGVNPGMSCQKRKLTRRLETQRDRLIGDGVAIRGDIFLRGWAKRRSASSVSALHFPTVTNRQLAQSSEGTQVVTIGAH